ncbi:MAG: glycosyl transferase [Alphaproteobacteria bacterium]|nr:glycosyl transferase [Alphaproteobacteria bacterium SS10]
MTTVAFYIQHLLGMGHVHRTAALAEATAKAGKRLDVEVVVINGGTNDMAAMVPNCRVEQLPAIGINERDFNDHRDPDGEPVTEEYLSARRRRLIALVKSIRPAALVLELYPFGRRGFRFELEPLLEEIAGWDDRPVTISSVRDVLVPPAKEDRLPWIADQLSQHIDHILVHGDPNFMRLEDSFPVDPTYGNRLTYTGFVVDQRSLQPVVSAFNEPGEEVIVSAGGGAVGYDLLACAMSAKSHTILADRRWHLICGPAMPGPDIGRLMDHAPEGILIERARPDMAILHARAALSIGQAGYNTVMEWIIAGRRGLAVPYDEGQETEQRVRAEKLAAHGLVAVQKADNLTPEKLAEAINALWERGTVISPPPKLSLDGAGKTAAFILDKIAS